MSNTNTESRTDWPSSARQLMALGIALLLSGAVMMLAALIFVNPAGASQQQPPPAKVIGGNLDWAFTTSVQADGAGQPSITVSGGAAATQDGTLRFPSAGGSYDTGSGTGTMRYHGTAVLTYSGSGRTVTLANPTVVMSASKSTLRADVGVTAVKGTATRPVGSGSTIKQAEIADLKTSGIPPNNSPQGMTWTQIPTTLTATGARALPQAQEGSYLGPVTVVVTLAASAARPTTTSPSPTHTTRSPSPTTTSTVCPTDSASPSPTSASPSPTSTCSDTPSPTATDTSSPSASPSDTSTLPKTGGKLAPIVLFGAVLTGAGGSTMMIARRKALGIRR